ncbi:unnamed protein product [Oikopleura dioica]|uniref:Myb-like domain-containing protein n=1 Tax=Oikopleura dioica TaxID=34765 RepID=E4XJR9_OIKDI|nr:unnamed protein product [Oikopleura dioica]
MTAVEMPISQFTKTGIRDEDANLIIGIDRFGADWKKIKAEVFADSARTNVNIKDRYRQLMKEGDPRILRQLVFDSNSISYKKKGLAKVQRVLFEVQEENLIVDELSYKAELTRVGLESFQVETDQESVESTENQLLPDAQAARQRMSNSDEAILEANSSPSTGLSCQEKTTPSKKSIRTRRLWDKDEDANLIIGIDRFGADWKKIKAEVFADSARTNVNIKDRYRQLMKEGDPRVKKRSVMIRNRKKLVIFRIYLIQVPKCLPPSAVEVDSVKCFFVNWIAS